MAGNTVQRRNDDLVNLLSADFQNRYEPNFSFAQAVGMLQMFPGVVGIWPGSVTDGAGQMVDVSGNGNHLTNNNTATFNSTADGLVPYVNLIAASSQYFSHATGLPFDITGTEAHIGNVTGNIRGLTMGGWVKFDRLTTQEAIMSKISGATGYMLRKESDDDLRFQINGVAFDYDTVTTTTPFQFVAVKYEPSTLMTGWLNGDKSTSAAGVPASITTAALAFTIGSRIAVDFFDGRFVLPFLCASAVPDVYIDTFYQQTRALFGV